jgi:hypothetical protein
MVASTGCEVRAERGGRRVFDRRIRAAALAAWLLATPDASALQITASAYDESETSFSPLDPAAFASFDGIRSLRRIVAAAHSDLVSGSLTSSVRVDSTELLPDCCSASGYTAGNILDDDLSIGGGTPGVDFGTLVLTLRFSGSFDATQLPAPPTDTSRGEFYARLQTGINGSSKADGSIAWRAGGPDVFETDLGTVVDAEAVPTDTGGVITMTLDVTPGDVVDFRMSGGATAWSGRKQGAYGYGQLRLATLEIELDGGLTWTSDSGVLLTPEPGAVACALAGLLAIAARALRDG